MMSPIQHTSFMTMHQIDVARALLREGFDLDSVAQRLGVFRRDLDLWLWRYLGTSSDDQPRQPMFD